MCVRVCVCLYQEPDAKKGPHQISRRTHAPPLLCPLPISSLSLYSPRNPPPRVQYIRGNSGLTLIRFHLSFITPLPLFFFSLFNNNLFFLKLLFLVFFHSSLCRPFLLYTRGARVYYAPPRREWSNITIYRSLLALLLEKDPLFFLETTPMYCVTPLSSRWNGLFRRAESLYVFNILLFFLGRSRRHLSRMNNIYTPLSLSNVSPSTPKSNYFLDTRVKKTWTKKRNHNFPSKRHF